MTNDPRLPRALRVCYFGSYARGEFYPRNTVLISALRHAGADVVECHEPLFSSADDKIRMSRSLLTTLRFAVLLLVKYCRLAWKYVRLPACDVVVVGYGGLGDVPLARMLTLFRRRPIVYDALVSYYDTVVCDRQLCRPTSLKARLLWRYDRLMCRLADLVLLDTPAHVQYFSREFGLSPAHCISVAVGCDKERLVEPRASEDTEKSFEVLFWGTFIPLHGLETIVTAAQQLRHHDRIRFTIIGGGQSEQNIRELAAHVPTPHLNFLPMVSSQELMRRVARASLCLGIFGTTEKAQRVIPCKVYDALCAGAPIVTGDTGAIRELLTHGDSAWLVPCGNADALAQAILMLSSDSVLRDRLAAGARNTYETRCNSAALGTEFLAHLQQLTSKAPGSRPLRNSTEPALTIG